MLRRRARTASPATWSICSWVMRMALRVAGSSPARAMRLSSSRQERPASTRTRVRELEMTVLLPLEPEASTVMRIIRLRYACCLWDLWMEVPELVPSTSQGRDVGHPVWQTLNVAAKRGEEVDRAAEDDLVVLVEGEGAGANDAIVLARVRLADADHLDLGVDGVAGANRERPAHLFDAGADHASGYGNVLHTEAHDDSSGEPSGGSEALEEGAFTGSFVEVKGLGIVLLAELFDLFCGYLGSADGVEFLTDVE